jgi:hypothetical protein
MGKCSNAFFSETTNMIKAKLYMNVHWMVLYKLYVFCSDMKFKMAAMVGLSLTLDPMGKMIKRTNWPYVKTMSCSGSHLGIPVNIKNTKFVNKKQKLCRGPSNDHSWAVWFQLSKWFQRKSVLKHFTHRIQC